MGIAIVGAGGHGPGLPSSASNLRVASTRRLPSSTTDGKRSKTLRGSPFWGRSFVWPTTIDSGRSSWPSATTGSASGSRGFSVAPGSRSSRSSIRERRSPRGRRLARAPLPLRGPLSIEVLASGWESL